MAEASCNQNNDILVRETRLEDQPRIGAPVPRVIRNYIGAQSVSPSSSSSSPSRHKYGNIQHNIEHYTTTTNPTTLCI